MYYNEKYDLLGYSTDGILVEIDDGIFMVLTKEWELL